MSCNQIISDSTMFKEQLHNLKNGATLFFMLLNEELQELISFAVKNNADIDFNELLESLPEYNNCKSVHSIKELKSGIPPKITGKLTYTWEIKNVSIICVSDLTIEHLNKFNFTLDTFLDEDDLMSKFSQYFETVCRKSNNKTDFIDEPYIVLFDVSRKED